MARPTTYPDTFPPDPPRDLDEQAAITDADWTAFDSLTEITNHWKRPGWSPTTRAYYWLLSITDPCFVEQAVRCQAAVLDHVGISAFDFVAPDAFHLTLGRVGLVDACSDQDLERLTATVQASAPSAFELTALPLAGSRGALRYSVAPWAPVIALHQVLAASSAACGLAPMKSSSGLRPHIGIGYCHQTLPMERVQPVVHSLRALPPVPTVCDRVDLVAMRREGQSYRWDSTHSVRLRH
ncbi:MULTISPECIES: 2'-5' RNA ligase family protein [unclassified Streptomyces]|uniref:2'-5' RNA ligase family protein n=1 Tax=unclassified Streptomyces TaxID=2593676 RepID=UPI002E32E301|nr:2'-5' RNA ligase family protein [Streptomyces sp. NBC_01358]MEE4495096.1 2'-5' RNA ligase family protein [Streptomyces sp. BE230]WSW65593.1 2'-5' RNA ligase family protein [Streptomyces sp. NBC_00995]